MLVTPLYQENNEQILPKMWQIHLIWVPNLKNVTINKKISANLANAFFILFDFLWTAIIPRVSHMPLYCVGLFIKVDFKK